MDKHIIINDILQDCRHCWAWSPRNRKPRLCHSFSVQSIVCETFCSPWSRWWIMLDTCSLSKTGLTGTC